MFENIGGNQFKLVKENDDEPVINIDRHGSFPNRPEGARFTGPEGAEKYNDHLGFDNALSGYETYPPKQIAAVKVLLKRGWEISGHYLNDDKKTVDIFMKRPRNKCPIGCINSCEVQSSGFVDPPMALTDKWKNNFNIWKKIF